MSVFWCLQKHRAKSYRMAEIMRRLYALLDHYDISLNVRWVPTTEMGEPDDYSRGIKPPPPARCLSPAVFGWLQRLQGGCSCSP